LVSNNNLFINNSKDSNFKESISSDKIKSPNQNTNLNTNLNTYQNTYTNSNRLSISNPNSNIITISDQNSDEIPNPSINENTNTLLLNNIIDKENLINHSPQNCLSSDFNSGANNQKSEENKRGCDLSVRNIKGFSSSFGTFLESSQISKDSVRGPDYTFHYSSKRVKLEIIYSKIKNFFIKKDPASSSSKSNRDNGIEKIIEFEKEENENENMFFKNNKKENLLRNSNVDLSICPKKLLIKNLVGKFLIEEQILIDPHGLNMLKTINQDGEIYFGEKINDVIIYKIKIRKIVIKLMTIR